MVAVVAAEAWPSLRRAHTDRRPVTALEHAIVALPLVARIQTALILVR